MLDEGTQTAAAAAELVATQPKPDSLTDGFTQTFKASDSIAQAVRDSLHNMQISDFKGIVTGENTILRDALSALAELAAGFVPKLIGAIIVLWIGLKLIKMLKKSLTKLMEKQKLEVSLRGFLVSLIDVIMKVLLIIMVMDIIGIQATSFIAILGAAGLAVGMALQGTLQNFASGVIILLMKPFKVDDYIECGAYKGYVKDIRIFHTIIRPFNGRTIIVPNNELATKSLINHTQEPMIRLDVVASVAYGTNLKKAKDALWDIINNDPLILKEPKAPKVSVSNLGDSSVDFTLWLWVKVEDYWTLWEHIREDIYNKFNEEGIEIPFPQIQLHTDK